MSPFAFGLVVVIWTWTYTRLTMRWYLAPMVVAAQMSVSPPGPTLRFVRVHTMSARSVLQAKASGRIHRTNAVDPKRFQQPEIPAEGRPGEENMDRRRAFRLVKSHNVMTALQPSRSQTCVDCQH